MGPITILGQDASIPATAHVKPGEGWPGRPRTCRRAFEAVVEDAHRHPAPRPMDDVRRLTARPEAEERERLPRDVQRVRRDEVHAEPLRLRRKRRGPLLVAGPPSGHRLRGHPQSQPEDHHAGEDLDGSHPARYRRTEPRTIGVLAARGRFPAPTGRASRYAAARSPRPRRPPASPGRDLEAHARARRPSAEAHPPGAGAP